jgi:hypothetical protein
VFGIWYDKGPGRRSLDAESAARNNHSLWLWVLAFARTTSWSHFAAIMPHRSRGVFRPGFASCFRPRDLRAQGRPGARCTHRPSREKIARKREDHRYRRNHTGLPCAVVYGLYVLSSVNHPVCHRRRREASQLRYDLAPDLGAPGPHDFARPRMRRSSSTAPSRPPHPRLARRDDRDAPLLLEAGWARGYFRFTEISRAPSAADWHDGQLADG